MHESPAPRSFCRSWASADEGANFPRQRPLANGEQIGSPLVPQERRSPVSVHFEAARNRWVVRWREDGKNRSRSFRTVDAAEAFHNAVRRPREIVVPAPSSATCDGIYPYGTRAGV